MKFQKTVSFIAKVKRLRPTSRSEAGLTELLSEGARCTDFYERKYWLEEILLWLARDRESAETPLSTETAADQPPGPRISVRFRYFFRALEKNPEWETAFRDNVRSFLAEARFLNFFAQTGFATEHGLWTDIFSRISNKIFPSILGRDFQTLMKAVFHEDEDVAWIQSLPLPVLEKMASLIGPPEEFQPFFAVAKKDLQGALLILSSHIAHHGMSYEIRNRLITAGPRHEATAEAVLQSSFLALSNAIQNSFYPQATPIAESTLKQLEFQRKQCEQDIEAVYGDMENSGVSVSVVHKLEILSSLLQRFDVLLKLYTSSGYTDGLLAVRATMAASAEASVRGQSVVGHLRHHLYLLSRKIVERNGRSGEHYIGRTPEERNFILKSGIGGGIIVVIMTIFKTLLLRAAPAPIVMAVGLWIIYAVGFLTMQFTGATLATKIPSFTASHLAGILKSIRKIGSASLGAEVRLIAKSQMLALVGNLIGVIPLALALAFASKTFFGHIGLMDEHYSEHILSDINPIFSVAILMGALTGAELWLSSVCGGWFENWVVFKDFPEHLRSHPRIKMIFGPEWASWASERLSKHASGVATNISLGFLFGFVPLLGMIFGLNLGGHHVTISTAAATFAFSELGAKVHASDYFYTVIGLILIGLMNFFVSFALALLVAANAQKMNLRRIWFYIAGRTQSE